MNVPVWKRLAAFWLVVVLLNALASCTITPRIVRPADASFDGSQKNSGFLGWTESGEGVLTSRARARYNELVRLHGNKFLPALESDYGIKPGTNGTFIITQEALVKFQTMTRWHKGLH